MRTRWLSLALVFSLVLAGRGVAAGQSLDAQSSGPLVLSPIDTRIVFSPDVKVTTVDHYTATLLGFYVAKQFENRLLIGGAGYWLVDPHHQVGLYYFGVLTGFRLLGTDRIALDGRVLTGFGAGDVYRTATYAHADYGPQGHHQPAYAPYGYYRYYDDFLVAEPQAVLNLGLTDQVRLNVGIGYRATTADYGLNDAFRGVTGSIGVRFDLK